MEKDIFLQPLQLPGLALPNRIVMTTVKLGYSNLSGEVTDRHKAFYMRRAIGGVGLITTEPLFIHPNGREIPTQLGVHEDALIPGLKNLTDSVHAAGGLVMAHINHAGRAANPKLIAAEDLVSASEVLCPSNQVMPRALRLDEIEQIEFAFGKAAHRIRHSGFDAIEIPFSHGYLIHQFLSPHTNRRKDKYGGSFENRFRFGSEIMDIVRSQVGDNFPIIVRMNATDYVEGGLEIADALNLAKRLEHAGANALSITSGTMCESVPFCLYPTGTPKHNLLPMSARIRETTDLPVIVAGRIRTPEIARQALLDGQADLIGLGRPLLADPDWVRKTEKGDEQAILLCAACHQGCLAQLRKGVGTGCVFNPLTGHEHDLKIEPSDQPKEIVVVGAGLAGLESATVAAQRGHKVTLYEQENRVGGQFNLAAKAPHKEEFLDIVQQKELIAGRVGVDIHLGTRVTKEMLKNTQSDVIILATGGIPLETHFPGLEDSNWLLAADVLDGAASVNSRTAFVIGGGMVGLETADFLASMDLKVTLVEMLEDIGGDMDILAKTMLIKRLKEAEVDIFTRTKVIRIEKDSVIVQQAHREVELPFETIVIATGICANRELPDAFQNSELEVHVIGDAVEPRKAINAIQEGFNVGNMI
jgi:2,4-dienoyl-CoA reductase-like NADH-dependent reductase (Old Yellow Enzyme family)/thioredoxin reductase